jgi:hypothetical protein
LLMHKSDNRSMVLVVWYTGTTGLVYWASAIFTKL